QFLVLGELEILQHRKVPVLLERAAIDVAAEVAEASGAEVGTLAGTVGGIYLRRGSECRWVQITVEALMDAAAGHAAADGSSGRQARTQQRGAARSEERGACTGIKD